MVILQLDTILVHVYNTICSMDLAVYLGFIITVELTGRKYYIYYGFMSKKWGIE